jgi:hypothetical protein
VRAIQKGQLNAMKMSIGTSLLIREDVPLAIAA